MTEETVKPVDLKMARELCTYEPLNFGEIFKLKEQLLAACNEIEKLRDDVQYAIRACRIRAGYKPVGKS